MKLRSALSLLLSLSIVGHGALALDTAPETTAAAVQNATAVEIRAPEPEPAWGRIYLRRGLAPIQYFRDRYGGPMVAREVEFVFPRRDEDRLGCELLPEDEQLALRAANGSAVLVVARGACTFETKARLAQQMGAAALVVVSEDESAKAPVAVVDKGEIEIASVMVRKSAGDMLRHAAARERVFGRLVPIVCERKTSTCKPRTAAEAQYVDEHTARSGVIVARASNATLGDFLAATYGSILPSGPLVIPQDVVPIEGCGEIEPALVEGKVALFSAAQLGCSTLDKVSSAQRAGAVAVLLAVGELPVAMKHPGVEESWHAYNITIAAATISSGTLDKLVQQAADGDFEIFLELRNRIADAWAQVRQLSVKTAWPTRKDRREKLLQHVVGSFELDSDQLLELKHNFVTVAGGSGAAWDQAVAPVLRESLSTAENSGATSTERAEVVVDAAGV